MSEVKLYVTLLVLNVCLLAGETGVPVQQSVRQVASNKTHIVTVTGYCNDNCRICCGIYASKNPRTASGVRPKAAHTIACNFLPFKSRVIIKGKTYTVEDRLHPRYKDRIDLYFDTHQEAKDFGKQKLVVTIHQTKK